MMSAKDTPNRLATRPPKAAPKVNIADQVIEERVFASNNSWLPSTRLGRMAACAG